MGALTADEDLAAHVAALNAARAEDWAQAAAAAAPALSDEQKARVAAIILGGDP